MEFSNDRAAQEYGLAGYFLVSTGKDQISDYATTPDNWWSGYNVNLGTPLGPYSYSNGLFRRDFTGGVVLLNEPGGGAKTINVGSGYSDLNGAGTQSVTLGARRAAILTKAGGAAPVAPPAPVGPPAPSSVSSQYLSDMNWTSAISAWGPVEKNTSNGELPAGDGKPLRINGTQYARGIGTHAYSEIHYALGGRCSGMSAVVGIDDEVPNGLGSVSFQVWADGVQLYDSGRVSRGAPALSVAADLSGRFDLSLIVNGADNGIDYDHADWADAKLTCNQ
jgi:alpha-galactosidase